MLKINKISISEIKKLITESFKKHLTDSDAEAFLLELKKQQPPANDNSTTNKQVVKTAKQQKQKSTKEQKLQLPTEIINSYNTVFESKNAQDLLNNIAKFVNNQIATDIEFINNSDPASAGKTALKTAPSNALIATLYYRVSHYFYYIGKVINNKTLSSKAVSVSQTALAQTGVDIHPGAKIMAPLFIDHGYGVVIGETSEIGQNCMIFNGVVLGGRNVQNANKTKRHPTLKNNVIVCAGAKILGNIVLGENVFVSPNAVVIDDIEDDHEVLIVNQLQIKKQTKNTYLPSQQVVVYGVVPKFKNSISILGEGFYNPNVLIKLRNNKELNYQITYWDKNKIIIKFKHSTPLDKKDAKGAKMIVFSNSHKVILLSSAGLEKALTTFSA